jgi:two-component system sensor histidine kinase DegS
MTEAPASTERLATELARRKAELERLELAVRNIESSWLFLERVGTATAGTEDGLAKDLASHEDELSSPLQQMRILEAQENERSRIAQELHDGPAQGLANAVFQVEIIGRAMDRDPDAARGELLSLRQMLDRELDAVRRHLHQLRPPLERTRGLDEALDEFAQQLQEGGGPRVSMDLRAPPDVLSEPERTVAIRVAQEALRNVKKHSRARAVTVSTRLESAGAHDRWIMEVADDGVGFDVRERIDRVASRHFGLRFMRERAQLIGANLDIDSEPGSGTRVRLVLERRERSQ